VAETFVDLGDQQLKNIARRIRVYSMPRAYQEKKESPAKPQLFSGKAQSHEIKVFDSLFVPLAKWSMLLTGNYRCITHQEPRSICDAVHSDLKLSRSIYDHVDALARRLGANPKDQVPFEKYAAAAKSLVKPSSVARAVANGAPFVERVDLLVKLISHQLGVPNAEIDRAVQIVEHRLNERIVSGGSNAS
jgi:hypothetical protein